MVEPVHDAEPSGDEKAALAVAAGGVVAFVGGWIAGSKPLRRLGLLTAIAGGGIYGRAKLRKRMQKFGDAATTVRSALDDLDQIVEDAGHKDRADL